METRLIVSAVVLVIAAFISSSQGIKCYVCNSFYHHDCDTEKVRQEYLQECSPQTALPLEPAGIHNVRRSVTPKVPSNATFTFCRKNVLIVPDQHNHNYEKQGTTRIIRSCGFEEPAAHKNGCKWAAASGIQLYMCECEGNSCNSASTAIPAILSIVLVAFAAISLH